MPLKLCAKPVWPKLYFEQQTTVKNVIEMQDT